MLLRSPSHTAHLRLFTLLLIALGTGLTVPAQAQNTWINELHYDNDGGDVGEFVEVALQDAGSYTLSDFTITLYNGNGGGAYGTETLDNFTAGATTSGFTLYSGLPGSSIQNGPDGVALDYQGTLVEFICYENTFTATDGPASGQTCTDMGVSESSSTQIGESLQRAGSGSVSSDFTWDGPLTETPGAVNQNQTFTVPTTDTRVQFAAASATAAEGNSSSVQITVDLTITNPSATNATDVTISVGGTADGTDASVSPTSLTFPAGSSAAQRITVTVNGDNTIEPDETVMLSIAGTVSGGDNADAGSPDSYTLTISNDDFDTSLPFAEDFEAGGTGELGTFTTQSVTSIADWTATTDAGAGANATDGYVEANGFGADVASDDWLVSPAFDLTGVTSASVSFFTQVSFTGPALTFNVTNSFTGDVSTTSWTTITIPAPTTSGTWEEESFDLSDLSGTDFTGAGNGAVVFAIQYTTTGTGGGQGANYRIDEVSVTEGAPQTTVAFDASTLDVGEGDSGSAVQAVGLTAANPSASTGTTVVVQLGGTATLGADYTLNYTPNGSNQFTVTFSAGASTPDAPIEVTVLGDTDQEGDEDITFDLVSVSGGESAAEGTPGTSTLTITGDDAPLPTLVINELLADPDAATGDANGDGTVSTTQDEFVEIYNTSTTEAVDLSGYTLSDGAGLRHTFADGTTLAPESALLVFGGGTPTNLPVQAVTASSGALGLNNGGDTVTLADDLGGTVTSVTYGSEGGSNQSLAREPDFSGSFVQHTSITSNPVQFSPGRGNTDDTVLPVELSAFTVRADGQAALLSWTTASETNNAGFEVQTRSADAADFVTHGFVEGAGSATSAQSYRYRIDDLRAGMYTFRLKQVDFDGGFAYSSEVELTVELAERFVLSEAYPNPFNPQTRLTLQLKQAEEVRVAVFDLLGRRVQLLHQGILAGGQTHTFVFDAGTLPSGLYLLRIQGERFSETRQVTLLK